MVSTNQVFFFLCISAVCYFGRCDGQSSTEAPKTAVGQYDPYAYNAYDPTAYNAYNRYPGYNAGQYSGYNAGQYSGYNKYNPGYNSGSKNWYNNPYTTTAPYTSNPYTTTPFNQYNNKYYNPYNPTAYNPSVYNPATGYNAQYPAAYNVYNKQPWSTASPTSAYWNNPAQKWNNQYYNPSATGAYNTGYNW